MHFPLGFEPMTLDKIAGGVLGHFSGASAQEQQESVELVPACFLDGAELNCGGDDDDERELAWSRARTGLNSPAKGGPAGLNRLLLPETELNCFWPADTVAAGVLTGTGISRCWFFWGVKKLPDDGSCFFWSSALNSWSKWPDDDSCSFGLSAVPNSWSKWPDDDSCPFWLSAALNSWSKWCGLSLVIW